MADIKANLIDETPVIKSSVIDWKGKDGYTPVKGVDYFDGKDGEDGKTPVKGVDYYTESDKAEVISEVVSRVPPYDDTEIKSEIDDVKESLNQKADQTELNDVKKDLNDLNDSVESLETNKLNKAELGTTPFVVYDEGLDNFANASGGYYAYSNTTKKLAETRTQSTTYRSIMLECQEGDSFTIKGLGGSSPRLYCFYDSERNGLLVAPNSAENDGSTILVAPPNTVGVQFCCSYTVANHELTWKMKKGELTVSELESLKADKSELDSKVGFTDYPTGAKGGVIKSSSYFGYRSDGGDGAIYARTFTDSEYGSVSNSAFIGKGTLENIGDDYVKRHTKEPQFELIEEVDLTTELSVFQKTSEPNGTPYNFKSAIIKCEIPKASSNGTCSVIFYDKNGALVRGYIANFISSTNNFTYSVSTCIDYNGMKISSGFNGQNGRTNAIGIFNSYAGYELLDNITKIEVLPTVAMPIGTKIKIYGIRA